jgi:tetratricopeptide (TPR) repeat protein
MTLSLALATAALLAAEPSNLPAGHPPFGSGAQPQAAAPTGTGSLPQGHPPMSGRAAPSAEELLKQLDEMPGLREREKTFEIASALGKLYYTNGRSQDAVPYFLQAEEKARAARELFLAQRKKLGRGAVPGAAEAGCGFTEQTPVEAMAETAAERARKGDGAGAAACARAALEPVLEVEAMHANALVLSGDAAGALKVYERVLEVAPSHADALFGRSALLYETRGEDLKALQSAHEGFEAFLAAHPEAQRVPLARKLSRMADEAVRAGGMKKWQASRAEDRRIRATKLDLSPKPAMARGPMAGAAGPMAGGGDSAPALSQETMEAMENVERTPELEAQLTQTVERGEELLARGRFDEALQAYRQVMPLRPDGRVKAGLAWTLVGLGKPTADRVWGVAVSADPAAVDQLGETLKAKGDAKGAKALWTKLASSAPDYAARASLQAKLSR